MYQMPVRAIKNILKKELQGFKDGFYNAYPQFIMRDVQKGMVWIAHNYLSNMLEACETYDELQGYLDTASYGMSLQEWIDSL